MTMRYLTPAQYKVLRGIDDFINKNTYSPTYREIAKSLNYSSVATVANHIGELKKKGYIDMVDFAHRSIRIISEYSEDEIKYN